MAVGEALKESQAGGLAGRNRRHSKAIDGG
jgi:hypothetical protein